MASQKNPFANELAHARSIVNAAEKHAATMSDEVRKMVVDRVTKIMRNTGNAPSDALAPGDPEIERD